MPFGVVSQVDPRNHVLDGVGPDSRHGKEQFGEMGQRNVTYDCGINRAKRLNQSSCRLRW